MGAKEAARRNNADLIIRTGEYNLESSFELVSTKMMSRMRLTDNGFSIWTDNGVIRPENTYWPELSNK